MLRAGRCYDCFRPPAACYCASVPRIANRTDVLILQHRRERFHPFNTARIVKKALDKCELLSDRMDGLAARMELKPRAGLLYPEATATLLDDLPPEERPDQLVILDGTWHHAKTLIRDLPALQSLPRYRLAPTEPSRYRIRREPNAISLSTVEAVVAALRVLEPETQGFEQLLAAFETMVENQLTHPGSADGSRFEKPGSRTAKHVPLTLLGDLEHIVVAYGETPAGERGRKRVDAPPISWVAKRLGDGETFSCTLTPPKPLTDHFLKHLECTLADFADAVALEEARERWRKFQRPHDVVTVFYPGTARLFAYLAGDEAACLVLKSVDWTSLRAQPLPEVVDPHEVSPNLGRASKRLAETIALVRQLNALARVEAADAI